MSTAITICATKNYTYAMIPQARRVQAMAVASGMVDGHIILAGDGSAELKRIEAFYIRAMPHWKVHRIAHDGLTDSHENYKGQAQLLIAQLRTAAFGKARELDVDYCLSLDSDVLPPSNAIRCMRTMLEFDDGYYDVATCTYPSQGGGGFLGGRGTPQRQILPDFFEDERVIPEEFAKRLADKRAEVNEALQSKPAPDSPLPKLVDGLHELERQLDTFPPKGNVWAMNAVRWRRRGWLENAYPAVGRGAVLPTDWCGFGCTMMNRDSLAAVDWTGYRGAGTEDLWVVWNCWHQRGMRLCVIPHCPCGHVIRDKNKPGKYIYCQPYFETEGEFEGHIRLRHEPFYSMEAGEKYNVENDGKMTPPPDVKKV